MTDATWAVRSAMSLTTRSAASGFEFALHLAGLVTFEHVAFLDVVVAVDAHAAFLAGADFLDIVLEPLEFLEAAIFFDHDAAARHTNLAVALDHPICHVAAGNHAHAGNLEHGA